METEKMRILIDTNILISAILFPNSRVAKTLLYVTQYHNVVLCDKNVSELRDVLSREKPEILLDAEILLVEMSYELIPATYHINQVIRDAKEQPILNAAIIADVDIILTGDKDFLCLDIEKPKCMTINDFLLYEGLSI